MNRETGIAAGVPADMLDAIEAAGLRPQVYVHPPVYTVEEAQAHWQNIPGAHTKNLFFKDAGGRLWLVTALADQRLDLKKLSQIIGSKRLSFGSSELLAQTLGVQPGSVSPLAILRDMDEKVTVVLDRKLMSFDLVNMHPGANTATIGLTPSELCAFLTAQRHDPLLADLDV